MSNIYIQPGFWVKAKEAVRGALDLRKAIRQILKIINVPYNDPCCASDPNAQPVRYNQGTAALEHFDGTSWSNAGTAPLAVPFSSLSTGIMGQIAFDNLYLYVCVAPNSWRRVLISAWLVIP
jgi:hypothetical protein